MISYSTDSLSKIVFLKKIKLEYFTRIGCSVLLFLTFCGLVFARFPFFLEDYWFSKWMIIYLFFMVTAIIALAKHIIYLPKASYLLIILLLTTFSWYFVSCSLNHIAP